MMLIPVDRIEAMKIARAAGADAANRQMRKAGRTIWSDEDYALACVEFNRIFPERTV
jgi:hypothetical protein